MTTAIASAKQDGSTARDLLADDMSGSIFIGHFRPARGGRMPVTDKATGEVLFTSGVASFEDVVDACRTAKHAQVKLGQRPPIERGDILRRFAQLCETYADQIGPWIIRETGSIPPKAPFEIMTSAREAIETAGLTGQPVGHILASGLTRKSYARRMPLGVVGVVTPWNSPFILAARAVLPALAMGNAVVLKPDLQTPVCGGYLLARLFELAGVPEGVFIVLPGGPDVGVALTESPDVNMISFTGSTATGRKVGWTDRPARRRSVVRRNVVPPVAWTPRPPLEQERLGESSDSPGNPSSSPR